MDLHDKELAELADITYTTGDKRKQRADKLGYDVDDELSNERAAVFKNRKTNKAVVAYRGTHELNDLKADAKIAVGKVPEDRVEEAMRLHAGAKRKYKDGVILTGHSLGGTLAHHVSFRYSLKLE